MDVNIVNDQGDIYLTLVCASQGDALSCDPDAVKTNWRGISNINACVWILFDYGVDVNFVGLDASNWTSSKKENSDTSIL